MTCLKAYPLWWRQDCEVYSVQFPVQEQIEDTLQIVKNSMTYTLPTAWSLSDAGSYDFNSKIEDRAFSHGGDVVGDGLVKGHSIKVKFSVQADTETEHDEILNLACRYFCQTDYKLYCGRLDRCFNVAGVSKISHEYQKGFKQRRSNMTMTLLLADPFRYQGQESKVVYEFLEDVVKAPMIVHNLGSVDTPLTFRLIPKQKMAAITIWHEELKKQMKLSDALLISPHRAIVNTKEGTVWRDNANSINTFSGQFLSAIPGKNTLYYTGGAGRIEVTFTNRWFL